MSTMEKIKLKILSVSKYSEKLYAFYSINFLVVPWEILLKNEELRKTEKKNVWYLRSNTYIVGESADTCVTVLGTKQSRVEQKDRKINYRGKDISGGMGMHN